LELGETDGGSLPLCRYARSQDSKLMWTGGRNACLQNSWRRRHSQSAGVNRSCPGAIFGSGWGPPARDCELSSVPRSEVAEARRSSQMERFATQ